MDRLLPESLIAGALERVNVGLVMLDQDERIVLWNPWMARASRRPAAAVLGRTFREVFTDLAAGRVHEAIRGVLADGLPMALSNSLNRSPFPLFASPVAPDRMEQKIHVLPVQAPGHPRYCLIEIFDVSSSVRREQALRRSEARAEAASLAKSQFLATMSHEIRTPLNGILGMAQILLMPDLSETERQDCTRTILTSGQTLLTLLNDILDLSKIEAGKLDLHPSAFSPAQIIQESTALFADAARRKRIQIETAWHGAEQARYLADPIRVRQMLSNLLSNAVKFTPSGHVRVEARECSRDGDEAMLEFSVSDSGIGIADDQLALLFQPFSQLDGSLTRAYGGSGLGLSIVRSLAEVMGGAVAVDSRPGKGSRFSFSFRARPLKEGENSRRAERQLRSGSPDRAAVAARILVVEDIPTNRKIVEMVLKRLGYQVDCLADGRQAVDAILAGEPYDLVLMDCHLPGLDGYRATQLIREWESRQGGRHLPIVALTADAFDEDRRRSLAAGMDDFLTKPIDVDQLATTLARWLNPPGAVEPGPAVG